ncbi:unnamed protein product [Ostreobium quekettii]|uniref:Uncharacterized protein n=1 Tax=Ostreobium quekettii TaxID=121088 RepID=A0A8S1IQX7_9CHLO|nr:unnamed protein product [Ostreobium quekettii]|eukprot:evm.model.scf_3517.1 EVM.evm.TU.scf_3517.1   scf_3517:3022-6291(-)
MKTMETQQVVVMKGQIFLLFVLMGVAAAEHNGRRLMGHSTYTSVKHTELPALQQSDGHNRDLKLLFSPNSDGGSGLGFFGALGSLISSISEDEDNGDRPGRPKPPMPFLRRGKCQCGGRVQNDIVDDFFRYCDSPDGNCCSHMSTAGAGDLQGCPCASSIACQIAPFNGAEIMAGCGYNYVCGL